MTGNDFTSVFGSHTHTLAAAWRQNNIKRKRKVGARLSDQKWRVRVAGERLDATQARHRVYWTVFGLGGDVKSKRKKKKRKKRDQKQRSRPGNRQKVKDRSCLEVSLCESLTVGGVALFCNVTVACCDHEFIDFLRRQSFYAVCTLPTTAVLEMVSLSPSFQTSCCLGLLNL